MCLIKHKQKLEIVEREREIELDSGRQVFREKKRERETFKFGNCCQD